jgi:hypothetical protein
LRRLVLASAAAAAVLALTAGCGGSSDPQPSTSSAPFGASGITGGICWLFRPGQVQTWSVAETNQSRHPARLVRVSLARVHDLTFDGAYAWIIPPGGEPYGDKAGYPPRSEQGRISGFTVRPGQTVAIYFTVTGRVPRGYTMGENIVYSDDGQEWSQYRGYSFGMAPVPACRERAP